MKKFCLWHGVALKKYKTEYPSAMVVLDWRGEDLTIMKNPYIDGVCEKCKNHYLVENGEESRCRAIKLGSSDIMCAQVLECPRYVPLYSDPCKECQVGTPEQRCKVCGLPKELQGGSDE